MKTITNGVGLLGTRRPAQDRISTARGYTLYNLKYIFYTRCCKINCLKYLLLQATAIEILRYIMNNDVWKLRFIINGFITSGPELMGGGGGEGGHLSRTARLKCTWQSILCGNRVSYTDSRGDYGS